MEFDAVLSRFLFLTDIDSNEAFNCAPFIYDAMAEISEMLLPEAFTEESSRRITAAAAALAAYRYRVILTARGDCNGIKAGDVTISPNEKVLAAAKDIYIESLAKISDLVKDEEFIFKGVATGCTKEQ